MCINEDISPNNIYKGPERILILINNVYIFNLLKYKDLHIVHVCELTESYPTLMLFCMLFFTEQCIMTIIFFCDVIFNASSLLATLKYSKGVV